MISARLLRLLLWVEIGLLAILIPLSAISAFGLSGWRWENTVLVLVSAVLFNAAALACVFARSRGGNFFLAALGIGVSLVSFTAVVATILGGLLLYGYDQVVWAGIVWTFTLAGANLYGLVRISGRLQWLTIATRVAGFSLAGVFAFLLVNEGYSSLADGILGVLLALTGAGLGSTLILLWMQSLRPQRTLVTSKLVLNLTCPRCGERQDMAAGRSRCRKCRLTISIEIEEERCRACGYALYRLTSDRCPECGTAVMAEKDADTGAKDGGAPQC